MKRLVYLFLLIAFANAISAQPAPCVGTPAMTSTCLEACVICDIDGFTGTNNLTAQGQFFPEFCTTQYNNFNYIAFIAGTENLEIEVVVDNCQTGFGVEIGFFQSVDCETFIPVTDCNTSVFPNTTVSFTNLVPLIVGGHYYLIMDGSNGDRCDWTFNVINGSTVVSPIPATGAISVDKETTCPDLPATFSVADTDGAALFYWTIDGIPHSNILQSTEISFPADGTYEVCVAAANACDEAPPTCMTYLVETPETLILNETLCDNDCLEVADTVLCETGNYEFHITLENGCDSAIFVNLEILPQAQSFIDINLCSVDTFFIGSTPYNQTGIFVDTIPTALDCDSIVTLDLFIVECEIIANTSFIQPICTGEDNGFLIFSVENGTPPFSYIWEHITDPSIGGTGSTVLFDNNQITNVPAGNYEININDTFGNNTVVFQEVVDPPVLNIAVDPIQIDNFQISCFGGSDGSIWGLPSGGVPPYFYNWSNGGTADSIVNLAVGFYTLNLTDSNGCEVSTGTELTQPTPISIFANYVDPNCDGYDTGVITIDSIGGGTPPYTHSIDNDSFDLSVIYNNLLPGSYSVYVQDDNDCLEDTTAFLNTPDIPEIFFNEDLEINLGCEIRIPTLTNNTTITKILWTPNQAMNCDTCLRPTVAPVDQTDYILTITSIDDCVDTDTINVKVIKIRDVYFPNAFSPNGDGVNDIFSVNVGKSVASIDYLKVYDRWGAQIYGANNIPTGDQRVGWDGYHKGKLVGNGVYIWMAEITYLDGFTMFYTGDISVIN